MFVGSSGLHLRTTSVLQSCSCSSPNILCSSALSESSRSAANATFTQWLWPNTSSNLNVNGSLWTLTIEMMLYISMPLLAWLIAKRPVVASLTLAAVGILYRLYVALDGTAYQNWRFGSNPDVNSYMARLFLSRAILWLHTDLRVGHGSPMGNHAGVPATIREGFKAWTQPGGGVRLAVAEPDHPQGVRAGVHLSALGLVHLFRLRHLPSHGSSAPVCRPTVHWPTEDRLARRRLVGRTQLRAVPVALSRDPELLRNWSRPFPPQLSYLPLRITESRWCLSPGCCQLCLH